MKKLTAAFIAVLSFSAVTFQAEAGGFGINSTRLIYPQGESSIVAVVRNTTTDTTYLVNASVDNTINGEKNCYFMATPPLSRLESGSTNQIRISMLPAKLPEDRETLFWFKANAIPASKKMTASDSDDHASGAVKFGIGNAIKLFYRPGGLKVSSDDAQKNVHFKPVENGMEVINSSPYYISFSG